MPELPSGTVTFLFTDVEGSTRLLLEHGDAYAALLREHRRAIRGAVARHGGVEMGSEGDALFVVFARAGDAVAAAAEAQATLADGPLRVRMGLHTGTPLLTEEGYVGIDVHRAARIAAAGHGGQTLLSRPTAELAGADVRDLGEHRLKDLAAPERIYQLGEGEFPPLQSLGQTNLPVPATAFLGRVGELAEVTERLASDEVRLLTLTGPGGTGKTRLALQAAADASDAYRDGVWWVRLAPLRQPALVLETVARALGARRALEDHIGARRMLIVLDNFEQVLPAAPDVAGLVAACPALDVLVTSRAPLRVGGEWEYRVDPLTDDDAVALFTQRARAVARDVELAGEVAEICRRLDRLPLALELAAARVKVLSPPALLDRLRRNVPVLATGGRDAPDRQRTLRATIEWSHDLLSPDEQRLFARLGVFAGGCTIEAAETVCDAELDTLASLVDKSLLRRAGERFWMLETIREFAAEMLDAAPDAEALRARHAEWFAALGERAHPHLRGRDGPRWTERLAAEDANLRAALSWSLDRPDGDVPWRLCAAVWRMWFTRGRWEEATRWLDATLARPFPTDEAIAIEPLWGAALIAVWVDDLETATTRTATLRALAERLDDTRGRAGAAQLAGIIAATVDDTAAARTLNEEALALARAAGDRRLVASSINNIGDALLNEGDMAGAAEQFAESLAMAREDGDPYSITLALINLSTTVLERGDREQALALAFEGLEISRGAAIVDQTAGALLLIALALLPEDPERGVRVLAASDAAFRAAGGFHQNFEREIRERGLAQARERLGTDRFEAAYAAGGALTVDDAVAVARAATTPPGAR